MASIYACQEIGSIACECNTAAHHHVTAENALVEIVDEQGRDVAPGGRGRVVVTGLYNYAMPFIRYEVGDIAVAGTGPCACGRTLPIIRRIEGRTRNVFVFRDGTRFWPRNSTVRPMHAFVPFRAISWCRSTRKTSSFAIRSRRFRPPPRCCGAERLRPAVDPPLSQFHRQGSRKAAVKSKRQVRRVHLQCSRCALRSCNKSLTFGVCFRNWTSQPPESAACSPWPQADGMVRAVRSPSA